MTLKAKSEVAPHLFVGLFRVRCANVTQVQGILAITILHGVSASGTRLSFYEYDSATHVLQPEQVLRFHSSILAT